MPSYKLTYFDGQGRAECARLLFAAASVSYEDHRISVVGEEPGPEWPAFKKTTPQGTLPVLNVDGKVIPQSFAICRYLAREFGLYGTNNWESTRIDVITETIQDIFLPAVDILFDEKDEEIKKVKAKKLFEETAPPLLGFLEKTLSENDNGNSFFVGQSVTLADTFFFTSIEGYLVANKIALDKFPKLKALKERIAADKKIAVWLAKRPQNPPF